MCADAGTFAVRNAVTQSNCGIVNGDKCIVVGRAAAGLIVLAAARVDAASIDAIFSEALQRNPELESYRAAIAIARGERHTAASSA